MTFEETIVDCVNRLDLALRPAKRGAAAAAALSKMVAGGEIKNIPRKLAEAQEELSSAADAVQAFRDWWGKCNLGDYFASNDYVAELTGALDDAGVIYHREDNVFYVYPALVRLDANAGAAKVDKKYEAGVRPRTLAGRLRDIQNRPARFPATFLGRLFKAYKQLASRNLRRSEAWAGKSVFLRDIYESWVTAPGFDYSEQELVRDVYLLDTSGEQLETAGYRATLEASSGTRDVRKTLSIVTRDGQRRLYCTIRFDPLKR